MQQINRLKINRSVVVLDKRKKLANVLNYTLIRRKRNLQKEKNTLFTKKKGLILLYQTFTFLMCVMNKMFHSASFCSVQVFSHWTISLFSLSFSSFKLNSFQSLLRIVFTFGLSICSSTILLSL